MSLLRYHYPATSWSPFNRQSDLSQGLDLLFGGSPAPTQRRSAAALDLYDEKDSFIVGVEVPGFSPEQLEIAFHEGVLTVSGERPAAPEPQPGATTRRERPQGKFSRSVEIPSPVNADGITATYRDGVLSVTLPKAEEAKPRRIDVSLN